MTMLFFLINFEEMSMTDLTTAFASYRRALDHHSRECDLAKMNWGTPNWTNSTFASLCDARDALLQAFRLPAIYAPLVLSDREIQARREAFLDFLEKGLAAGTLSKENYDVCMQAVREECMSTQPAR